jgi:hypothetical protein
MVVSAHCRSVNYETKPNSVMWRTGHVGPTRTPLCPTLVMLHWFLMQDAVIRRPAKVSEVFIRMSFLVKLKSRYQQIILASSLKRSSQTETMYYRPDAFAGGFWGEVDRLRALICRPIVVSLVYSESEFIGYDAAAAIPSWDSALIRYLGIFSATVCSVAELLSKLSQSFLHYHSAHLVHFPQRHHVAFNAGKPPLRPHVPGRLQTLPSLSQSLSRAIIIAGISIFLPANLVCFWNVKVKEQTLSSIVLRCRRVPETFSFFSCYSFLFLISQL